MEFRGGGAKDWVRHELCGQLVSNLFSSKTLRERLSKKPVAGILVGLLCGQPYRANRTPHTGQSVSSELVHKHIVFMQSRLKPLSWAIINDSPDVTHAVR